ncbi:hypothetical protein HHX47_DHR4000917 [Lentinula edodes]|nr:hypothetical protein HHX47_DHR4000917 [Lentinula edodes]
MAVSWRERVDTASAIKGILDSYPSNSILREILQNSDDAGATKQIFVLDHREHGTKNVVEDVLKRTQGPALLAVNDSVFTKSDWEAVRTIHGSNKSADETKTGKYGLGIRACYHVTDNIHILSGNQLVIFDPHEEFQTHPGGLALSLNKADPYQDQISAFSGAIPDIPHSFLKATVVRLPLRTTVEAQRSKIKPSIVSTSDIQVLYRSFIQNELSVALLFLKNIMSIELREITREGLDTLVAKVEISNTYIASLRQFMPGHNDHSESYKLDISTTVGRNTPVLQSWHVVHGVVSETSVKAMMTTRLGYDVGERLRKDKLSSHVALALPLSHKVQGRLFTLLPLPISTGFPIHVHGIFALTPDRQSLRNSEELGIGTESRERLLVTWNRVFFEELIPKAWASLLIPKLVQNNDVENIWDAWPPKPEDILITPVKSMLDFVTKKALASRDKLFPAYISGKRIFIRSSDPALVASVSNVGQKVRDAVSRTGIAVIVLPLYIFSAIQSYVGSQDHMYEFHLFNPKNLHRFLQQEPNTILGTDSDKDRILDYLIATSPDYIIGLPLVPTVHGDQLDSVTGQLKLVAVPDDFPLPILQHVTFIDMSKASNVLGLLIEPDAPILDEVAIMALSIQHLSEQPEAFQDLLMAKIIPRLLELTQETREGLRHQRFVPAVGSPGRVSPADIIDPKSLLSGLYQDEQGRFPMPPYSDHIPLSIMRTAGLYSTKLSSVMLEERIQYISSGGSDPSRIAKAKILLGLLSDSGQWNPSFVKTVVTDDETAWIPNTVNTCIDFWRAMGCTERPMMNALIEDIPNSETLDELVAILSELSSREGEIEQSLRERIFVPDHQNALRKLSEIYFNDMNYTIPTDDLYPLHPAISKTIASNLGVPFLSSLQLDEQDDLDVDDEDMSESLILRIKNVLVAYDKRYAFNEFLANAVDADASRFKVLLDAKRFNGDPIALPNSMLCPEMAACQEGPALVLHNDAKFSEADFKGIKCIGEGGKQDRNGTIGKFGLGALSFYHFSEIAFIISGEFILILDPSAAHLPKKQRQMRRSIRSRLTQFRKLYGGHLLPFDGLFGFSLNMDSYPGTLIRLPLRKHNGTSSSSTCLSNIPVPLSHCRNLITGPYEDLSRTAPLFTSLEDIAALERRTNGEEQILWEIETTRTSSNASDICVEELRLSHQSHEPKSTQVTQRWLLVKDTVPLTKVPSAYLGVVLQLKALNGIDVSIAFCLDRSKELEAGSHLFCGLQLPEVLSVPVHINATFAISSDRRSIRFDPPDSNGNRVAQSGYNAWLLSDVIPPIYFHGLRSLFSILKGGERFTNWWPKSVKGLISKQVVKAFYASLPATDVTVFPTVTNQLIAPRDAIISKDEPESIRKLLSRLRVPNYVVLGSRTNLLPTLELRMLNPDSLSDILKESTTETISKIFFDAELPVYRRMLTTVKDQTKPELMKTLIISMIDATLQYLLQGNCSDGHTLLLLVTRDLELRHFNDSSAPTYCISGNVPDALFPQSRFLSNEISRKTQILLMKSSLYRVEDFDKKAVVSFVEHFVGQPRNDAYHSVECSEWINLFWNFYRSNSRPRDLKLKDLASYPLLATFQEQKFVSLQKCRSGGVLPDPEDADLRDIMYTLNITVLQTHPVLPKDEARLIFSFSNLLDCLQTRGGDPFRTLSADQSVWFATWIVRKMTYGIRELSAPHLTFLSTLRLWNATRNGIIQRLSADELYQLPSDIELSRISRFLKPDQAIAEYAIELQNLWSARRDHRGQKTSNDLYEELYQKLFLPFSISEDDIDDYKYLLKKHLWNRPSSPQSRLSRLQVPDGRLRLRSPGELFESNCDIFRAAFHYSQEEMFIHPRFRDLERSIGITANVTLDVFQQCARAIHNDQSSNRYDEIISRATTIYAYYNHQLPSQIMANKRSWEILDDLRFIPRSDEALEEISFDTTPYLDALDHSVLSPRELLRREYQSVAWTQRTRFLIEPSQNLIAVYPDIGVPTAQDVVAHLVILATRISQDHPHDRGLIRDLKATYTWLQDHQYTAGEELRKHQHERIFLNVDDIDSYFENWQWRSSQELILNLSYDSSKRFRVKSFLSEFRRLLGVAGVRRRVDVNFVDETQFGDPNFERLRAGGKLLDIELRPEYTQENEKSNPLRLKAHAAFLAAHVPHIETALNGVWKEATSGVLSFPGTYFAACAFLDLVYTGDLKDERSPEDDDGMELLMNLLEMLPIAHEWGLPALKMKLGWLITSKYLFIQPETLKMIRDEAQTYEAPGLVKACDDFAEKNAGILPDLKE